MQKSNNILSAVIIAIVSVVALASITLNVVQYSANRELSSTVEAQELTISDLEFDVSFWENSMNIQKGKDEEQILQLKEQIDSLNEVTLREAQEIVRLKGWDLDKVEYWDYRGNGTYLIGYDGNIYSFTSKDFPQVSQDLIVP